MSLPVKIKKLNDKAVVPHYSTEGSAGLDFTAVSEKIVVEGAITYVEYGTGLAMSIPKGFVGLIFPRSSISSSTSMVLANSVGVIDSDYTGEIKFRFKNIGMGLNKKYKVGDRIGQIVVIPYPKVSFQEVDDLDETKRGSGGFGSTNS
jgi:dUTP pyrophosphatase